jgi:hypothetical protein
VKLNPMKRIHLIRMICWVALACAFCGGLIAPPAEVLAQSTGDSANPSLSEFSWLEGKWQGNWGPRVAEQIWLEPRASEMTGLFRVTENDKTLVLELYSLLESSSGIEMRLRHFTPALVPWEQSAISVLRLVSFDRDAVFENGSAGQPNRQTLIRVAPDTYLLRTEIGAGGGNKQVTEIRFHRVVSVSQVPVPEKKKKPASH